MESVGLLKLSDLGLDQDEFRRQRRNQAKKTTDRRKVWLKKRERIEGYLKEKEKEKKTAIVQARNADWKQQGWEKKLKEKKEKEEADKEESVARRKRNVWVDKGTNRVTATAALTPTEAALANKAFYAVATNNLVCRRSAVGSEGCAVLPDAAAVRQSLLTLGIFLPVEAVGKVMEKCKVHFNVSPKDFANVVLGCKQLLERERRNVDFNADLLEAYTALGGNPDKPLEGGIKSANIHGMMNGLGVLFDEKAKIDDSGDLVGFDYDQDEVLPTGTTDLDDLEGMDGDGEVAVNADGSTSTSAVAAVKAYDKDLVGSITTTLDEDRSHRRRARAAFIAVRFAVRLRTSLVPWFLDPVRRSNLPSTEADTAAQQGTRIEFKPAKFWGGRVHGYFFGFGKLGLGYYLLKVNPLPSFHDITQARAGYQNKELLHDTSYLDAAPTQRREEERKRTFLDLFDFVGGRPGKDQDPPSALQTSPSVPALRIPGTADADSETSDEESHPPSGIPSRAPSPRAPSPSPFAADAQVEVTVAPTMSEKALQKRIPAKRSSQSAFALVETAEKHALGPAVGHMTMSLTAARMEARQQAIHELGVASTPMAPVKPPVVRARKKAGRSVTPPQMDIGNGQHLPPRRSFTARVDSTCGFSAAGGDSDEEETGRRRSRARSKSRASRASRASNVSAKSNNETREENKDDAAPRETRKRAQTTLAKPSGLTGSLSFEVPTTPKQLLRKASAASSEHTSGSDGHRGACRSAASMQQIGLVSVMSLTTSTGFSVAQERESGLFSLKGRREAAGQPAEKCSMEQISKDLQCLREVRVAGNDLADPSDAPANNTSLKVTAFAPIEADRVFKEFELGRQDKKFGDVGGDEGWAAVMNAGGQPSPAQSPPTAPNARMLDYAPRSTDKRVSEQLRDVVLQVMANSHADAVSALWKRERWDTPGQPGQLLASGNRGRQPVNEYSWVRWRESCRQMDNTASDVVSRTFTERLAELDDMLVSDDEEEEYVPDPEMTHKFAKFAAELGLRSANEDQPEDGVADQDVVVERLSQLSDIQTADHIITFEDFAAFFDRFRTYKGYSHVSVFRFHNPKRRAKFEAMQVREASIHEKIRRMVLTQSYKETPAEAKPAVRRARMKTVGIMRVRLPSEASADDIASPTVGAHGPLRAGFAARTRRRGERASEHGETTVLVTAGGSLVQPLRMPYRHTHRVENGALVQGSQRFVPFDWASTHDDIQKLTRGEKEFDDAEAAFLKNMLRAFHLQASQDSVHAATAMPGHGDVDMSGSAEDIDLLSDDDDAAAAVEVLDEEDDGAQAEEGTGDEGAGGEGGEAPPPAFDFSPASSPRSPATPPNDTWNEYVDFMESTQLRSVNRAQEVMAEKQIKRLLMQQLAEQVGAGKTSPEFKPTAELQQHLSDLKEQMEEQRQFRHRADSLDGLALPEEKEDDDKDPFAAPPPAGRMRLRGVAKNMARVLGTTSRPGSRRPSESPQGDDYFSGAPPGGQPPSQRPSRLGLGGSGLNVPQSRSRRSSIMVVGGGGGGGDAAVAPPVMHKPPLSRGREKKMPSITFRVTPEPPDDSASALGDDTDGAASDQPPTLSLKIDQFREVTAEQARGFNLARRRAPTSSAATAATAKKARGCLSAAQLQREVAKSVKTMQQSREIERKREKNRLMRSKRNHAAPAYGPNGRGREGGAGDAPERRGRVKPKAPEKPKQPSAVLRRSPSYNALQREEARSALQAKKDRDIEIKREKNRALRASLRSPSDAALRARGSALTPPAISISVAAAGGGGGSPEGSPPGPGGLQLPSPKGVYMHRGSSFCRPADSPQGSPTRDASGGWLTLEIPGGAPPAGGRTPRGAKPKTPLGGVSPRGRQQRSALLAAAAGPERRGTKRSVVNPAVVQQRTASVSPPAIAMEAVGGGAGTRATAPLEDKLLVQQEALRSAAVNAYRIATPRPPEKAFAKQHEFKVHLAATYLTSGRPARQHAPTPPAGRALGARSPAYPPRPGTSLSPAPPPALTPRPGTALAFGVATPPVAAGPARPNSARAEGRPRW